VLKRSINWMEVGMRRWHGEWILLVMCFFLASAVSARAATYTLTCEPTRGDAINIVLTGFNFKVMGGSEASPTGAAATSRRSNFELSIRLDMNKDYELLVSMAEDNEEFRSCKLTDGGVSGGATATDNWNQMSAKNKNSKVKNNAAAPASSGAFEWILTNATITSVSAIGSENASGAAENSVQATIEAQKFSFTM
jgi:hypothetical protein